MYIKYVVKLIETESRGACKMTVVWEDAELASPTNTVQYTPAYKAITPERQLRAALLLNYK